MSIEKVVAPFARKPTRRNGAKPEIHDAEMPAAVKELASQTVDRAEAAFDKASAITEHGVQLFDRTAVALRTGTAELQARAMEIAQVNVDAVFAYARKLIEAKSVGELMALHQSYVREQAESYARQAQDLNALSLKLVQDTVRPVGEDLLKSMSDLRMPWLA